MKRTHRIKLLPHAAGRSAASLRDCTTRGIGATVVSGIGWSGQRRDAVPRPLMSFVVFPALRLAALPFRGVMCFYLASAALAVVLGLGHPDARGAEAPLVISQPFAARSGPRGPTLFASLAPARTGVTIENRYNDPTMWWERYQEFSVGAIGTGVAVGDFDLDGRPDLFVVSKTESCRLYRNLGNWTFADVTERAGVGDVGAEAAIWKQGATFVDVDNDGRLDLYLCRFGAPNRLYMNQGDGTFREEAAARGLALSDASGMAAFADYDRDGWLDVYIQTNLLDAKNRPNGQPDRLFRNRGRGIFVDVTAAAGITGETQGHSVTWWDYDQDGWPDLYVANDFAVPDQLYRNQRDGTFRNVAGLVLPYTPYSAMGSDVGDVDNDGRIDLLVADMAAVSHAKDQRGMADSRTVARDPRVTPEAAPQLLRNTLFLNTGTGRCEEAAYLAGLAATDWTWSVRFEDLDNDGRIDLHVTNGMVRELHNLDLLARMMVAESPAERIRIMRSSPVLSEANLAYRNHGDLRFEEIGAAWGLNQRGVSFGAAFADFDGDGDLDLAYTNFGAPPTLLRNDSDSGHRLVIALRGTTSNRQGVGAIVRVETEAGVQVRTLTLARGYLSSSEPVLHFGLGEQTRVRRLTLEWPSGVRQVLEDLAADRRYEVTEPSAAGGNAGRDAGPERVTLFHEEAGERGLAVTVREADVEETAAQPLLPVRHNRRGPALAVADLEGDGTDDLLVGGSTLDLPRHLARGPGDRWVSSSLGPQTTPHEVNDGPLLVFDANRDGRLDVWVSRGGSVLPAGAPAYQPSLLLNGGRGVFLPEAPDPLPPLPITAGAVAAADFDRDGSLDVFMGGRVAPGQFPLPPRSALVSRRGGRWQDVTASVAPGLAEAGMVTSALWTDVDGDGWIDLLLTLDWGGVQYWRNRDGKAFDNRSEEAGFSSAGLGWWTTLAAADFNRDGRPDYVAGNVGLNTPYQATPEHPERIYLGEFREGAAPVLIEATEEGGRVVPRRTLKQLAVSLPALRRRYPKINDFARATLGEVLGEGPLAAAQSWTATEFRSGVFLSQPGGRFRFEPLPRRAQLAPWQGVVAGDWDGDGLADLVVVQNSRAPVPTIGRFEGGLGVFLKGNGRGGFEVIETSRSGWSVPGDARAVVAIDLDRDRAPDLVVSRNDAPLLAFRNRPEAGRRFLALRLRGKSGNPQAVGARVTVTQSDGKESVSEVYAGSCGAGQSTAVIFVGFPENQPPTRIQVRWPDGRMSEHVPDLTASPEQRLVEP